MGRYHTSATCSGDVDRHNYCEGCGEHLLENEVVCWPPYPITEEDWPVRLADRPEEEEGV